MPGQDRIEEAVRAVLGSLSGAMTVTEATLLSELEALGREVARAKSEIAALRVDDINASHSPAATDELDAVVEHTAEATNEILDSCETLEALQPQLSGAAAEVVAAAVTRIYEACSFQDITGQRIGKVVAALKAIERRVIPARDKADLLLLGQGSEKIGFCAPGMGQCHPGLVLYQPRKRLTFSIWAKAQKRLGFRPVGMGQCHPGLVLDVGSRSAAYWFCPLLPRMEDGCERCMRRMRACKVGRMAAPTSVAELQRGLASGKSSIQC
jgi:chemotaxis protein CheZ